MAEFAPGAGGFAVEVEVGVGDGENFGGFREVADEIEHGAVAGGCGGAKREAEDGAEMILKLAGDGAFDGPVAGIVDARSHFVNEKFSLVFKEFKGEDADVFQGFEDAVGGPFGGTLDAGLKTRGGRERQAEDAVAVMIFHQRVDSGFAIAGADREDGEFTSEQHETLEDKGDGRHLGLGFGDILRGAKNPLALAVVAHARSFKDSGKADGFYGGVEFVGVRDGGEFSGRDAEFAKERLLGEAVLRGCQSGGRRIDGDAFGEKIGGFNGNVFKFVGDQFEAGGKFFEGGFISVVGGDTLGDAAYGRFGRGIEKTEMQTQRVTRESEHVAELSAAEDADGHARLPFFFAGGRAAEGSGLARTRPVCSERNLRKASRMARCFAPRMEAARSAALTAPDLPMASVPTGMPAGICAMERSESRPFKAFDSTGTPRTGRTVFEAVMPGRCAAPPAPAIMTSMPRFSAVAAYSKSRSGVRWAETTRVSCGTRSSLSVLEANFMVSQSEPEPMMMPTRG